MTAAKKPATTPLPCPFCGGRAMVGERNDEVELIAGVFQEYRCRCSNAACDVLVSTRWHWTAASAIAAWNRRAK